MKIVFGQHGSNWQNLVTSRYLKNESFDRCHQVLGMCMDHAECKIPIAFYESQRSCKIRGVIVENLVHTSYDWKFELVAYFGMYMCLVVCTNLLIFVEVKGHLNSNEVKVWTLENSTSRRQALTATALFYPVHIFDIDIVLSVSCPLPIWTHWFVKCSNPRHLLYFVSCRSLWWA